MSISAIKTIFLLIFQKNMVKYVSGLYNNQIIIFFGGTKMAYKITADCISCGACAGSCPTEAIVEGDPHYTINADICIDCGACVGGCPLDAIVEA